MVCSTMQLRFLKLETVLTYAFNILGHVSTKFEQLISIANSHF